MLEQGCVVMDRWMANRCFGHKEEMVHTKVLRRRMRLGPCRRKGGLLKMVHLKGQTIDDFNDW